MERIELGKDYSYFDIMQIKRKNRQDIGYLPIHENLINKYVTLVSFSPLSENKLKIYLTLNKNGKMGMLNRHVLSVARHLGVSQIVIKLAKESSIGYKKCKNYIKKYNTEDESYWNIRIEQYREDIRKYYILIIDMVLEEFYKRNDIKYVRNKKLKEINDNNHY